MDSRRIDDLRKAYDGSASARESGTIQDWKRKERDDFCTLLKSEGIETLLEIGSGPGRDGLYFTENGIKVTCIDLSPEHVRLCREKGLDARVMDVGDMNFPANSFDAAYAMNSLLHVPKTEIERILEMIRSVLKPSGLFYMGVYGGYDFEGMFENDRTVPKRFFTFYTDERLRDISSGLFDVIRFNKVTVPDRSSMHFQSLVLRKRPG
ncbi:MAG: class I SAM-dependent methyltransferase [Dehalococcoidales bacterium]|nr:class I SAM-dependent methyltransferase [Dehalococcoidales bacterium]